MSAPSQPLTYQLDRYTPIAVAPGAPGTRPLAVAGPDEAAVIGRAALDQAQAYSDAHGGHALIVWQGGKIRYERYGPGLSADTRFETFSMHKSVLGLVYGAALRDGIIRALDDKVGDYLPAWRDDPRGQITLRQLLTMESGLEVQKTGVVDAASALASPLDQPPGGRFDYNNANSQIAGMSLNHALKAAGQGDYAAYVSKVLLRPLGAGDAHLWLDHEGGEPHYYAHFQVRARDWLRIGVMIDHRGRFDGVQVLPATWIEAMTTASPLNPNYGLQMWIGSPWTRWRSYGPDTPSKVSHEHPYSVSDLVYFDGFGGQRVYVSPSLDLVIVRLGQPDRLFDDSVLPNTIIAGMAKAPSQK